MDSRLRGNDDTFGFARILRSLRFKIMWKQAIKHSAAVVAERLGTLSALAHANRDKWTIVCYHRVLPAAARAEYFCPDLVVTPEALRAHCAVYREHFEVLPVREAFARMCSGALGEKPLLSLSFDDGYRDNFEIAAPILEEHGLRASFYVIAGLVDTKELPWYDRVALSEASTSAGRALVESMKSLPNAERIRRVAGVRPSPPANPDLDLIMTSAQLRGLHDKGHEIGSHSLTHPILTQVEADKLPEELHASRVRLEGVLGAAVDTFCYPNGNYNAEIVAGLRDSGYKAALSTLQGLNRADAAPCELRRVFINEDWLRRGDGRPSGALLRAELGLLHRIRA